MKPEEIKRKRSENSMEKSERKIWKDKMKAVGKLVRQKALKKEPGIDGILVTVGLCIIALLLCVVMKDSLTAFIQTIVTSMTQQAQQILSGVTA